MFHRVLLGTFLAAIVAAAPLGAEEGKEAKVEGKHGCFEMRTYTAAEGKLEALQARFRDHTNALFLKHGMTVIGYWVPMPPAKEGEADRSKNTLVYILAYPDKETRDKMWKEFAGDPDWKTAQSESEKNGKLVTKVESVF